MSEKQGTFVIQRNHRFVIKPGWDRAGEQGQCFGTIRLQQWWGVVLFDGEDDPDLYKLDGLDICPVPVDEDQRAPEPNEQRTTNIIGRVAAESLPRKYLIEAKLCPFQQGEKCLREQCALWSSKKCCSLLRIAY